MDRINTLFDKYHNNQCSPAEIEELLEYFKIGDDKRLLKTHIELALGHDVSSDEDLETATNEVYNLIKSKIFEHNPNKNRIILLRWFAAASILLLFGIGDYFYLNSSKRVQFAAIKPGIFKNDVQPGSNNAILTLSNGQQIVLKNAKNGLLVNQGNTYIRKTDGQLKYQAEHIDNVVVYNTVTTKRANKYDVTLPDGTIAYLDAASSIHFPTAFNGKDREVTITGQVYFEVAHNKSKPFRVKAKDEVVEVLGTHFNINAYEDEPIMRTTLIIGSVKITRKGETKVLVPGEQAQIGTNVTMNISNNIDLDEVMAWKNGLFKFNNTDLQTTMRQLSRWYDVDVIYEGVNKNYHFGGYIPRNSRLSETLKILQLSGVKFSIDGNKLTVYQ